MRIVLIVTIMLGLEREEGIELEPLGDGKKKLIVNADDFGLTEGVNQAILRGHREGIITSTSLLANGRAFDSAVALTRESPSIGVGVHLNLTEGAPLCSPSSLRGLVDPGGSFCLTSARLALRLLCGAVGLNPVERELRAQIERLLAAGIRPTHLDSHKHMHLFPSIFRVLIRLAGEYGIGGIRCVREKVTHFGQLVLRHRGCSSKIVKQYLVGFTLSLLCMPQRRELRRAQLKFPTYCFGITPTGFLDALHLRQILEGLPDGATELICHPGTVDGDLRQTPTRLLNQRERELQAILAPEAKAMMAQLGIRLINYAELE